MKISDIEELVYRLTKPTYVLRMARAVGYPGSSSPPDTPLGRSARTRAANAAREIQAVVDDLSGVTRAEAELWERAERAEVHSRRLEAQAGRTGARVDREMYRLYRARVNVYLEAIAVLRGGLYAHAFHDVLTEWGRRGGYPDVAEDREVDILTST